MAYKSTNPATGETVAEFANHSDEDINNALAAADAVYRSDWSQGPIHRRLQVLSRLADLIDARAEDLARVAVREMGKRISEARWEVDGIAKIARHFADNAAARHSVLSHMASNRLHANIGLAGRALRPWRTWSAAHR